MRTIQFREAVCEAMSEEMRRDPSIYLMGEEVAEYKACNAVNYVLSSRAVIKLNTENTVGA